nr:MAG TPA: hypothetical protein [Caudoviricetes sp.]
MAKEVIELTYDNETRRVIIERTSEKLTSEGLDLMLISFMMRVAEIEKMDIAEYSKAFAQACEIGSKRAKEIWENKKKGVDN